LARDENGNLVTNATQLSGKPTLTFTTVSGGDRITRSSGKWSGEGDGFFVGDTILIQKAGSPNNNRTYTIAAINPAQTVLTARADRSRFGRSGERLHDPHAVQEPAGAGEDPQPPRPGLSGDRSVWPARRDRRFVHAADLRPDPRSAARRSI